jgi:hypothetical protein
MSKAREAQMRKESRQPRAISEARPVIESDAIKKGLEALSTTRVEDTLLAEAADLAPTIERFRGGKAEHNEASLATVLGANDADTVKRLQRVGFLEAVGS